MPYFTCAIVHLHALYRYRTPSLLTAAADGLDVLVPKIKVEQDASEDEEGEGTTTTTTATSVAAAGTMAAAAQAAQVQLVAQQRAAKQQQLLVEAQRKAQVQQQLQQQQRKAAVAAAAAAPNTASSSSNSGGGSVSRGGGGTSNSKKQKGQQLRRGKWTPEEEAYANRLIQEFKAGLLPLTDGTTLRTFLSKLLNCDPMRISKKFVGSNCIGKQVFRRRTADLNRLTPEQIQTSRAELSDLERRFLERVAQTNRVKNSSNVASSSAAAAAAQKMQQHYSAQQQQLQHAQAVQAQQQQLLQQQQRNGDPTMTAAMTAAAYHGGLVGYTPPWMQPPEGYRQGFGAQMAQDNLASNSTSLSGNRRTAAAGRALLEGLGGTKKSNSKREDTDKNTTTMNSTNLGGAMAELQRRMSFGAMGTTNSAQNLLAALSGNSNQSLVQMARNASAARLGSSSQSQHGIHTVPGQNSISNLMAMKPSGFSREQLHALARESHSRGGVGGGSGLSSASLSNMMNAGIGMPGGGHQKSSFDQLMSLDFQSLQSIDNLANLIQTGGSGIGGGNQPSAGMQNSSFNSMNTATNSNTNNTGTGGVGNVNSGFGDTSLSNAARRLESANNFESLMQNLSRNNNNNNCSISNHNLLKAFGNNSSNNNMNSNNNTMNNSSVANLHSLLQSMNGGSSSGGLGVGGAATSMSSLLNGSGGMMSNTNAASLANLLNATNHTNASSTGLSALRNADLNRNTTSVEDFLSLVAAGDIPHQDPTLLNNPLNQNGSNSNNNNSNTGGVVQQQQQQGNDGNSNNNNIKIEDNGASNDASVGTLGYIANSRANFSTNTMGSTSGLLQQLADAGGSSESLSSMKRKLLDVDGSLNSQGSSSNKK